ncbi:hypothetical protein BP6252_09137 [Coleophoma cylindrospora]|uniref:HCP-like protein n=1 Tax=Coleophoma cylindrospora TaxID=1849047 RepID=A0A3D8R1F3_9HELO|nr:hypothetical protein BP6252_09137 [Coleophoma cylindrospora]
MAKRPNYIDLRSQSHGTFSSGLASPRGLPSPRLHVAGEIPPDLSPLDAFAAQSRLLAKQLEEESYVEGKRISRLPALGLSSTMGERPGVTRSASTSASISKDEAVSPISGEDSGMMTEVEHPEFRPVSVHPRMSGVPDIDTPEPSPAPSPRTSIQDEDRFRGRMPSVVADGPGIFGARREQSPGVMQMSPRRANSPSQLRHKPSTESMRRRQQSRRAPDGSLAAGDYDSRALAPPRSPMLAQRQRSPSSLSTASEYEVGTTQINTTGFQRPRRRSSGSGFSVSPISPVMYHEGRSPSISSEISVGGTKLPRPAFNFSRPLSRASLPPVEVPSRQASEDSQPSFILVDDTAHTPVSMHSEGFPDVVQGSPAAPTYVYSKFSLPRGKMMQRNSLIFQEGLPQAHFQWEQPVPFSNVQSYDGSSVQAPPSPPSRPSTASIVTSSHNIASAPSQSRPSLDPDRPSFDSRIPSYERGRSVDSRAPLHSELPGVSRNLESSASSTSPSMNSESTIRARRSMHSLAPSAEGSAEEHVTKAIELHENGALKESTYHLRLAARQNHPTGMLLYALACRHGWGMRPNQREGVHWLRKAADFASLEVADDEETAKDGKPVDLLERKTRKAQFALSIYELGVSHMNGWGIEQDKVLALRCFEIAGSWGDADALAEAGFCYAQGVGCKKDLKKSAKFYREAEAKGISMIGNSWIYKPKYQEDDDSKSNGSPGKRSRNKSRTRTMFGRIKPTT